MKEAAKTRVWKLELSYDGSGFHGWQIQPELPTIQGELRAAIARVTGETILPQGSGRTDCGVHAFRQVASFPLSAPIPEINLIRALNRTLPPSIRVLRAEIVSDDFHARHSAKTKTYEYRIYRGEICPPWMAPYCYAVARPLEMAAMQEAAALIAGEHDFTSFAAGDPDFARRMGEDSLTSEQFEESEPPSNIRTIHESCWYEIPWCCHESSCPKALKDRMSYARCSEDGSDRAKFHDNSNVTFLTYVVKGNGFLHHMVRNLVGTMLEVGRGRLEPASMAQILAARDRSVAGPTAPARGLFLREVSY